LCYNDGDRGGCRKTRYYYYYYYHHYRYYSMHALVYAVAWFAHDYYTEYYYANALSACDDRRSACQKTILVCPSRAPKNHILKYIVIILYVHTIHIQAVFVFTRPSIFRGFFFVRFVCSTRVVYNRRRHRLYSLYTIRGRVPLYPVNNITKSALFLFAICFFTVMYHTLLGSYSLSP